MIGFYKARLSGVAAGVVGAVIANLAFAGPASERVFSRKALDLLSVGQLVEYSHTRGGTAGEAVNPISDGQIRVQVQTANDGSREAEVTMGAPGKLRPVSVWPASAGNPILPIFLESALRSMSNATGGSTFYIRNRIKDALGTGGTITTVTLDVDGASVEAQEIVFALFENDKNRDRMGAFADMTLTFVVSEQTPGDIIRFTAETGDGDTAYREEIAFQGVGSTKE
ncbi:MAG: hypothetical protein AAF557_08405 [Pseudomonadota bacterium]